MSFTILLWLSVAVFLLGLIIRFSTWFSQSIDPNNETLPDEGIQGEKTTLGRRLAKGASGTFGVVCSTKILKVIQSLFIDTIFQKRILDKSLYRWLTHTLIFFSFVVLLFSHALGNFTFSLFGSQYVSTLNPSLTLRNVFGLLALIGVGMAVYRRITIKKQRFTSYSSDWTALALIAVIMVSGFLLEGSKISSYSTYVSMTNDYGMLEGEEAKALEAYWVAENGLHSPNISKPVAPDLLKTGRQMNEWSSCIGCHASNTNAFVSFSIAGAIGPMAAAIGDGGVVTFFRFVHILSCLGLLAWLPFSKMFHIVSAPLSLAINRVMGKAGDDPVNALNRQLIGLTACTHCGACTVECSSQMFYESFDNDFILPSEKVQYLKKIAAGKEVDAHTRKRLQQGLYICTSCDRCTDICPSGINLRDLFINSRYYLLNTGTVETSMLSHFSFPLSLVHKYVPRHAHALHRVQKLFEETFTSLPEISGPLTLSKKQELDSLRGNTTFKSCYSCQRCTNICPVVRRYETPAEALDMMPHQIIFSLGIGNQDMALGARMIWSCSTCYLCQEHCPNGVELTDIFYRLKNKAINAIEVKENV